MSHLIVLKCPDCPTSWAERTVIECGAECFEQGETGGRCPKCGAEGEEVGTEKEEVNNES